MKVSTAQSFPGDAPVEALHEQDAAVAPNSGAGPSQDNAACGADTAGSPANLASAAQASDAGLQTASSLAQASSEYLGSLHDLLLRMAEAAGTGQGTAGGGSAVGSLASMQAQLREEIGGSADLIGGVPGSPLPGATFDGVELIGSKGDSPGGANLREGAILSLVQQDSSGNFTMEASGTEMPAAISGAFNQLLGVGGAAQALSGGSLEASRSGEGEVLSGELTGSGAASASESAAGVIRGGQTTALAACACFSPRSALGLLQADWA